MEDNLKQLLEALKDVHPINRKQAVQALAQLGDKSVIDTLTEILLNDESPLVRQAVAQAFQKGLEDPSCLDSLIKALKDPDEAVRGAAAAALGVVRDNSAVPHLCEALKDQSEHVRGSVIYTLGKIRNRSAVIPLQEVIAQEEVIYLRDAAREAVRKILLG